MTSRPALAGTRLLFRVAGLATLLAVSQLYLFPADTDRFFAWTVNPPISAAFMGSGFAAGMILVLGMWRQTEWAAFRLSFLAVFAFSVVTLAATLLHLDRFHFGAGGAAEVAAWVWLAVYVAFPFLMAILLVRQARVAGGDPPVTMPMPPWVRRALLTVGTLTLAVGVVMFFAPASVAARWPWALSPLVSRALSAWMLGLGLAALLAVRERDLRRLRVPGLAYAVFAGLVLLALFRLGDQVDWSRPGAWVLTVWLVVLAGLGGYGASRPLRGDDLGQPG